VYIWVFQFYSELEVGTNIIQDVRSSSDHLRMISIGLWFGFLIAIGCGSELYFNVV
jgi:hypothetical protein